jgi:hypothetical protein
MQEFVGSRRETNPVEATEYIRGLRRGSRLERLRGK